MMKFKAISIHLGTCVIRSTGILKILLLWVKCRLCQVEELGDRCQQSCRSVKDMIDCTEGLVSLHFKEIVYTMYIPQMVWCSPVLHCD